MGPQWAETDTQSLSKTKIRTTMPENTHVRSGVESAEIPAVSGLPTTPASHGRRVVPQRIGNGGSCWSMIMRQFVPS